MLLLTKRSLKSYFGVAESQYELCDRHILRGAKPRHWNTTMFKIIN
ncbi:hypothetical protein [Anabaena subtropica]|uniref:Transposase n=1 Tax=Anabaena subtropica FACHB-260 TaxID=2692884 RepID=A0ABR8CIC5_9NOST|nr:hypothetical protein [Anabaena subtropica]MBD2342804.1 hypothetical protein [Anabaena subtropica FACHB-260]